MKKLFALLLAALMVFAMSACTGTPKEDPNKKSEGVMTYAQYAAAAIDSEVTIEAYVQAKQSWWDNKATIYTQDGEGGYFLYEMAISEADFNKLVPGTKIRVKGFKSEWAGEVEITDATFEILEGNYVAAAEDVTSLIGTEDLAKKMNKRVIMKGLTVEAQEDGAAFNYKNTDEKTDDLYFKASVDGKTVNFCVEFYLTGKDTDVYKAVEGLKVGDKIDVECYLYWYNDANPHVIGVTVH